MICNYTEIDFGYCGIFRLTCLPDLCSSVVKTPTMPNTSCRNSPPLAAIMLTLTLTLTLLVPSAHGFNLLRGRGGNQQLPFQVEIQNSAKRSAQVGASRFVVVLDAGSSSTKANVFEFHVAGADEGSDAAGTLPVNVTEVSSGNIQVTPSLDTFADKSGGDELRDYVSGVFDSLENVVLRPNDTSLYVLATAGMRQLQKRDAEKARKLIAEVQSILSNKTVNPYSFHEDHFRILNGKEEGLYAWLAANFLNGFFHTATLSRDDSVGVLEMGGSSLQIAYMLPQASKEGCIVEVTGHPFELHVDSYAGFGASSVIDQVLHRLCAGVGDDGCSVDNPCMLTGDSAQVTCKGDCQKVVVNGASNSEKCTKMLEDIVEDSISEQLDAGSLLFYAIGAFHYSLKALCAVDNDTGILDINSLQENDDEYCQKTLKDAARSKDSDIFVSDDYIQGLFISELLDRLDLDDNVIKVSQEINNNNISWALGAALDFMTQDISVNCSIIN